MAMMLRQVSADRAGSREPVTDQFVLRVMADKPQSSYARGYTRTDYASNAVEDEAESRPTPRPVVISPVQCPSVSSVTSATLVRSSSD